MLAVDVSTLCSMEETFGERLRRLRDAAGLDRQELADAVGISRSAIALLENGQSKSMEPKNLLKAAHALGVDPHELQFGEVLADQLFRDVTPPAPKRAAMRHRSSRPPAELRDVPVIGFVVATATEDGYFDDMGLPTGAGDEYLPWPTRDPNAYAVRVRGDSMQPRIRPGELIVVEPNSSIAPGDDVVVRLRNGRKMVKQLLYRRAGEIVLGSINQAYPQISLLPEDFESMHRVAAIAPRASGAKEEP